LKERRGSNEVYNNWRCFMEEGFPLPFTDVASLEI